MSANDTQVGGTHYKSGLQHWDLAHILDLGYFEGQITKYITRHRFKKGREDADKCLHFTRKLRELAVLDARQPRHKYGPYSLFGDYQGENKLNDLEIGVVKSACGWRTIADLDILTDRVLLVIDQCYPATSDSRSPVLPVLTDTPYGYCPQCGAPGVSRERSPYGNDRCANGHSYSSRTATVFAPHKPAPGVLKD